MNDRVERCMNCKFGDPDGESGNFLCRRYPPTAHALTERTAKSGMKQVHAGTIGVFVPVRPNAWCGEFVPALVVSPIALATREPG